MKNFNLPLLLLLFLLFAASAAPPEVLADGGDCIIPPSGPWPSCATGGDTPVTNPGPPCPPEGVWPPGCDPASVPPPAADNCVIPPTGPWPPCATGGNAPPPPAPGGTDCIIPPSGPWPPCATGGTPAQPPAGELNINSFSAHVVPQEDGPDEIHFSWDTSGASSVDLYAGYARDFALVRAQVGASGSIVLLDQDPTLRIGQAGIVIRQGDQVREQSVTVQFSCQYDYFFDDSDVTDRLFLCPSAEARDWSIVWQPFERGFMVYAERNEEGAPFYPSGPYAPVEDGKIAYIAVFIEGSDSSPRQYHFTDVDRWREGDMVSDPALTPPDGLFQPVRGFGKMWREGFEIRERIGWATARESADSLTFQPTDGPTFISSNTVYYQMPHDFVARYLPERNNFTDFWEYIGVK